MSSLTPAACKAKMGMPTTAMELNVMATEYAPRLCAIFMGNKSQAIELRKVESNGYLEGDEEDARQLVQDICEAKEQVSQWAVWDNREGAPKDKRQKPYSAAEFRAMVKGEDSALVWCKRGQFRAPVLKIGIVDSKAATTGKRAAPKRFGRGA